MSASFVFENTTLQAGKDIHALVTLSRAVTGLEVEHFTAGNASVKSVAQTEDPLVWEVVLTRSESVAAPENVLRLDLAQVEITPGVYGSGAAVSAPYAVDTVVGAWVSLAGSWWDTGASAQDNLVNHTTPYLRGEVLGELDEGDQIELLINGEPVGPGRIELVYESTPVTWSFSPREGEDPISFSEGINTIEVRVVDEHGNHGSAGYVTTIVVDTVAPELDVAPDAEAPLPLDQDIVITFKEPLYWTGGESEPMPITVYCPDDERYDVVYVSAAPFLDGGSILTLAPDALGLEPGKQYELGLPAYLTDYAGNSLAETVIDFRTLGSSDAEGPSATHALVDGKLFYTVGDRITFRIKFDEDVQVRTGLETDLSIGLSNGQRADFERVEGDELVFGYTVADVPNVQTCDLTITDAALLASNVEDLAGNPLDGAHILFEGIHEYLGYGYGYLSVDVVIDTETPDAPGVPVLDAGSDSGEAGDKLTSDATPTVRGQAEDRAWIHIYDGDTLVGSTRADASGAWNATLRPELAPALADGRHDLTVRQTDRAGNASEITAFSLTIDTVAAAPGAPALKRDTGSSALDRVTSDPTLKGGGAEAHARIEIMRGDEVVGYGGSDADGDWEAEFGLSLPDGEHTVTVRQIDGAGNVSAVSAPITFTLDTAAPAAPAGAPDLAAASDSGISNSDNITNVRLPTFSGVGAGIDAGVALFVDAVEIGRTTADASGNWTFTVPGAKALADGTHQVTVRQVDSAGNLSGDSAALALTVDTVGPSAGTASVSVLGRKFSLPFNEAIVFQPGGSFNLFEGSIPRESYWGNSHSGWNVTADAGGVLSVLNFNISLNGMLRMQWNNGSVTDLAGNAALVGVAGWDFTI